MSDLVEKLQEGLKSPLPAQAILSRFKYLPPQESSRPYFYDPEYYPFYFHMGRHMTPTNVFAIGLGIGLSLSCFLLSCKTVKGMLAFQRAGTDFYSPRFAKHNIHMAYKGKSYIHVGSMNDQPLQDRAHSCQWDMLMLTEQFSYDDNIAYLRLLWSQIANDGLLIMDFVNYDRSVGRAYRDFCKEINREPTILKTKYGVGLICK